MEFPGGCRFWRTAGPRDRTTLSTPSLRCLPALGWCLPSPPPPSLPWRRHWVHVCMGTGTGGTLPPTRSDSHGQCLPSPVWWFIVRVPDPISGHEAPAPRPTRCTRGRPGPPPQVSAAWGRCMGPQEVTSAWALPPSPGNQATNSIPADCWWPCGGSLGRGWGVLFGATRVSDITGQP